MESLRAQAPGRMSGPRGGRLRPWASSIDSFPLFPLGLVMLPSELVPLHIFEERYKLMIARVHRPRSASSASSGSPTRGCRGRLRGPGHAGARAHRGRADEHPRAGHAAVPAARADPRSARTRPGTIELLDDADEADASDDVLDAARERYASLVERVTDRRPDDDGARGARRLRHGGDDRVRARRRSSSCSRSGRSRGGSSWSARCSTTTLQKLDPSDQAGELAKSNGKLR